MGLGKPPLIVETCGCCGRTKDDHDVRHIFVSQKIEDVNSLSVPPSESETETQSPSDLQEEGPEPEDDGRPSQAEGRGEMVRRYTEQHLCIGCEHVEVCEMGRHTAEMFREGWFAVISDCNFHESAD